MAPSAAAKDVSHHRLLEPIASGAMATGVDHPSVVTVYEAGVADTRRRADA